MGTSSRWSLSKEEQSRYTTALGGALAPLRAKAGITQGELAYLAGVSRQTYSAIEGGKKPMSWSTYLALILFFDYNQSTHQMIRNISVFPEELVTRFNAGVPLVSADGLLAGETTDMLQALDEQGLHALKTVLLVEYARCTDATGDMLKAIMRR